MKAWLIIGGIAAFASWTALVYRVGLDVGEAGVILKQDRSRSIVIESRVREAERIQIEDQDLADEVDSRIAALNAEVARIRGMQANAEIDCSADGLADFVRLYDSATAAANLAVRGGGGAQAEDPSDL